MAARLVRFNEVGRPPPRSMSEAKIRHGVFTLNNLNEDWRRHKGEDGQNLENTREPVSWAKSYSLLGQIGNNANGIKARNWLSRLKVEQRQANQRHLLRRRV